MLNTEELKTLVPFEVRQGFARIAHDLGMDESELLREMIMVHVLGVDAVRKLYEERLARVVAMDCRPTSITGGNHD